MGRWIIGIGLVVVIGIGAFIVRDRLSSNAGKLVVGDCFDVPVGTDVGDVQHQACTEAHDGEVIFVGDFTGSVTYPTSDALRAWVGTECVDKAFQSYVGDPLMAHPNLTLGYFYPKAESWGKDKKVTCYISPIHDEKVSRSFAKGAAPAAS